MLKNNGYNLKVINLLEMDKSDCYNPVSYTHLMDKELTIIAEPEELIAWADTFDIQQYMNNRAMFIGLMCLSLIHIFSQNVKMSLDFRRLKLNGNILICGGSGAGKT